MKSLLLSLMFAACVKSLAQQPASTLDLSSGKWKVFGRIIEYGMKNCKYYKFDHFFTDDQEAIKLLEQKSSPFDRARSTGFEYLLTFVKDDSIFYKKILHLEFWREYCYRREDSEADTMNFYWQGYSKIKSLMDTIKASKQIPVTIYEIDSLEQARKLYQYLKFKKDLMVEFFEDSSWLTLPGYTIIALDNAGKYSDHNVLNRITDTIRSHYLEEKFKVCLWGQEGYAKDYRVFCIEKLGNELKKLFKIRNDWTKIHSIFLEIYGLDKKEIEDILKIAE